MDRHLQPINFGSQLSSRWGLQILIHSNQNNDYDPYFMENEQKFGVVVAKGYPQHGQQIALYLKNSGVHDSEKYEWYFHLEKHL